MLAAIVFDFDGLIIDSESAVFRAWQATFAEYGVEFPLDIWLPMVGTRELDDGPWRFLREATGRDIDRHELERAKRERSIALAEELQPLPGVASLLEAAHAGGVPLAIASSSSAWWVEGHLKRLGLRHYFSVVCTAEHAGLGKPSPEVYHAAVAALGAEAGACVALEDSEHGITAAKAAGLRAVAVPGSFSERMDFDAADLVVRSLEQLDLSRLRAMVAEADAREPSAGVS